MEIIEMTQNTLKRRDYDSRDHRTPTPRFTIAKVSYGLLRNKGKGSTCISFGS